MTAVSSHSYAEFAALTPSLDGAVLTITMANGPMNALTPEIHSELARIFRVANADPAVRVVIVTGAGERGFSAGADIDALAAGIDDLARWSVSVGEAREIVTSLLECDKPVIARINGHAVGFGATLALYCDVSVMADTAKIGDPHVKIGLVAGDGGALLWPRLVGLTRARRYLLTGDLLSAGEAEAIGLVTETVSPAELDAACQAWVDRFAAVPFVGLSLTKRALNAELRREAQVLLDTHLGYETLSRISADHREAILAAAERRKPSFTGR